MRISRVKIENYRNLRSINVTLGKIVTLIGENNSGKSNFLRAISLPLSSDDVGINKHLSWYDINREAKEQYYCFLRDNRQSIAEGTLTVKEFLPYLPIVTVQLYFQPEDNEHYDVSSILCNDDGNSWLGGILYRFYVKKPDELFERVKEVLAIESEDTSIKMNLLPMEFYTFSLTVPGKDSKVPYETLSNFRSVFLPAERDNFASSADKLGSKALTDLLQKGLAPDSRVRIEKKYSEFFETVQDEGKLDTILNWQDYSDIPNASDFFQKINILPNMPQMSNILGSGRLGYADDNMFEQGLGHRNLILMAVILNSYINREHDISFRLITVEEPEAHLCNSNVLLMISLFHTFSQKNKYSQIIYSTHNAEFVNKVGLDTVVVFHNGSVYSLNSVLNDNERQYLAANPNTDIFTMLYAKKIIFVEGITEELLIKSYFQRKTELNEIKVLSFHKGFKKIIDIWKKINEGNGNKCGIVRDFDDQPKAQAEHEAMQNAQVIVRTTKGYTLETDVISANYKLLKEKYGSLYGWSKMNAEEMQRDWQSRKTDIMLRICQDMVKGELDGFILPPHIQEIIDFMQGDAHES